MRLSDIDLRVDGISQSEIVEGRMARDELITRAARRGDPTCRDSDRLASMIRQMGHYCGSPWDEEIGEDDL